MTGPERWRLIVVLAIAGALLAIGSTGTRSLSGLRSTPSPVGSPADASPVASPLAEAACPGAAEYLAAVEAVLAPLVRADDPASLTADWTYIDPDTFTGGEWREISARYGEGLAAWNGIIPPVWAEAWHRVIGTELSLRTNASLAAATRGVYSMGAYAGAIAAAREASVAALGGLDVSCPWIGSALDDLLGENA